MSARTARHFDREAAALAPRYDSLTFEDVHASITAYLPPFGAEVLDIGAGSGRDARGLAALGYRVTAVEPSAVFRSIAAGSAGPEIVWLNDRLPQLARVEKQAKLYAFILCSAVMMYLPARDIDPSFAAMARLMSQNGHLAISVRAPMLGEPPELVHRYSNADLIDAARRADLELVEERERGDALGRADNCWRSLVFKRRVRGNDVAC